MKRRGIIAAWVGLLSVLVAAARDPRGGDALAQVRARLEPLLSRLEPAPVVEAPPGGQSLVVTYVPQTYKVHARSMTGQVATNVHDEVGPGFKGFVLRVQLQDKGEVNQACTPQTIQEPYWLTDLEVTPLGDTDQQLYWSLSYMRRTSTNVLEEIRKALKDLAAGADPGGRPRP